MNNNEEHGHYITIKDGTDFRKIAKILTSLNYPMNHATARNVLINALTKLAKHVTEKLGNESTEEQITELLKNQLFHESLSDLLFEAYLKEKGEKI